MPSSLPSLLSPSKHHKLPYGLHPITTSLPEMEESKSAITGEECQQYLPPTVLCPALAVGNVHSKYWGSLLLAVLLNTSTNHPLVVPPTISNSPS